MDPASPVLLIHGIDDTGAIFDRLSPWLATHGWVAYTPELAPNNGEMGLDGLAEQVAEWVRTHFAASLRFHLIGFSMGGLVARYYVQRLGGLDRVERFITISTPHHGTWTAFGRWNAGARQMRPGSTFLQELNQDVSMLVNVGFTSIWTPLDLMIVPANSSVLEPFRSIPIAVAAHPLMVRDARVLRTIQSLLERIPTA